MSEPAELVDESAEVASKNTALVKSEEQTLTPLSMIHLAISKGADIDQLSKLMDLHERWEANEARKAYVAAMSRFKETAPEIHKNKKVDVQLKSGGRMKYAHATLDNVAGVVGQALADVGIAHRWEVEQAGGKIRVTCVLTHELGHSEHVSLEAGADDSGSKNHIQAIGSTVTYLERYTLLAATGLAVQDDDDGHLGSGIDPKTGEVIGKPAAAKTAPASNGTSAAGAIAAAAKAKQAASIDAQAPAGAKEPPKKDDPHAKARARYWALHGELGLPPHNDPIDKQLNYWAWAKVLGREVSSMTDITIVEMSKLIDWAVRMLEGWTDERGQTKKWAKPNYEEQRLKLVAAMQPALEEAPLEGKSLAAAAEAILDTPGSFKDVARRMGNWTTGLVREFQSACDIEKVLPDAAAVVIFSKGVTSPEEFIRLMRDPFETDLDEEVRRRSAEMTAKVGAKP